MPQKKPANQLRCVVVMGCPQCKLVSDGLRQLNEALVDLDVSFGLQLRARPTTLSPDQLDCAPEIEHHGPCDARFFRGYDDIDPLVDDLVVYLHSLVDEDTLTSSSASIFELRKAINITIGQVGIQGYDDWADPDDTDDPHIYINW